METKLCPFCGKEINVLAKKCKHCGNWLESSEAGSQESLDNTQHYDEIQSPHSSNRKSQGISVMALLKPIMDECLPLVFVFCGAATVAAWSIYELTK